MIINQYMTSEQFRKLPFDQMAMVCRINNSVNYDLPAVYSIKRDINDLIRMGLTDSPDAVY